MKKINRRKFLQAFGAVTTIPIVGMEFNLDDPDQEFMPLLDVSDHTIIQLGEGECVIDWTNWWRRGIVLLKDTKVKFVNPNGAAYALILEVHQDGRQHKIIDWPDNMWFVGGVPEVRSGVLVMQYDEEKYLATYTDANDFEGWE
jgi:hypothetical protein